MCGCLGRAPGVKIPEKAIGHVHGNHWDHGVGVKINDMRGTATTQSVLDRNPANAEIQELKHGT